MNSVSYYNVDYYFILIETSDRQNETICVYIYVFFFICIDYSFYVVMKSLSLSLIATRVHFSVLMSHCLTCL